MCSLIFTKFIFLGYIIYTNLIKLDLNLQYRKNNTANNCINIAGLAKN